MKVDRSPEEIKIVVSALEHWEAYLKSQRRENDQVDDLLKALRVLPKK